MVEPERWPVLHLATLYCSWGSVAGVRSLAPKPEARRMPTCACAKEWRPIIRVNAHAAVPASARNNPERYEQVLVPNLEMRGEINAKAQTWKERPGGFGSWARLHGNELFLWSAQRQAGDDVSNPGGRGTRRHVLRH